MSLIQAVNAYIRQHKLPVVAHETPEGVDIVTAHGDTRKKYRGCGYPGVANRIGAWRKVVNEFQTRGHRVDTPEWGATIHPIGAKSG